MKKYAAVILVSILLIVLAGSSYTYAAGTASGDRDAAGYLKDVKYDSEGSNETVTITVNDYSDYSFMELSDPQRIVLDIFNAEVQGKQKIIEAGGKIIKRVRYAQFEPHTARVVLDVNGGAEYGVEKTDTGLVLYVGEKPVPGNKDEGGTASEGTATVKTGAVKQIITVHSKFKIQYTPGEAGEDVAMLLSSYAKYKVARLTSPDRLLITIPNAQFTSSNKQVNVNGNQIKAISYAKSGKAGASITLSLNAQSQYSITEAGGKLLLTVRQPDYRNIEYHNTGDRVYFTLKDAMLTEGDRYLKELYTGTYDDSGKKYTVTFPSGQADLGNGVMEINDQYLQSAEIKTNPEEGTTSLTFIGAGKNTYFAYTRNNPGITSITVLKPAARTQKLVVIDAGHGGDATGAVYGNLLEKNLNLDIAKRLNTLLEKKGVKTYMIRGDDSDIANYERAYIANELNAKLYLSIHNNAMDDKDFRGTMTLYCPSDSSSFTGKSFAGIIHQKLLASLNTVDGKIRERPDLIVLRETTMPAALAEVAFLTNSTDRSSLQKATFRQKAAQALCDSVIKALAEVK